MAKRIGIQVTIVPDVYSIGLFRRSLSSSRRLRVTTAISLAAMCGVSFGLGWFLKEVSRQPWLNTGLLILLMGGIIFSAYLLALTVGDIIFPGPWRQKMRDGDNFSPDDVNERIALQKNKNIYFILLWLFSIIGVFFICNFASGQAIFWYAKTGNVLVSLRSENVSDRAVALHLLSNPLHEKQWNDPDIRHRLAELIGDADTDNAAMAMYIAGRAKIVDAAPGLIRAANDAELDAHLRAEAITALGRLEWKPARGDLLRILDAESLRIQDGGPDADSELITSVFYAFYDMHDDTAVATTVSMLDACNQRRCSLDAIRYAFFYLAIMKAKQSSATAFRFIDSPDATQDERCAAADSLRWTAPVTAIPDLKLRFQKTPRDLKCPDVFRKYHQEAAVKMYEHDQMRALYLRAVGNHMRKQDYDWIWVVGSDEKEDLATRKVAEIYTRAMNAKK